MKNMTLKLSLALGLMVLSGNQLSADKYWEDIQTEKNALRIMQKTRAHIKNIEAQKDTDPTGYINAKLDFWTKREALVEFFFEIDQRRDSVERNFEAINSTMESKHNALKGKLKALKNAYKESVSGENSPVKTEGEGTRKRESFPLYSSPTTPTPAVLNHSPADY